MGWPCRGANSQRLHQQRRVEIRAHGIRPVTRAGGTNQQPFFESSKATDCRHRALLVSFHFPPDPAVGGLRWQELARYFAARGWAIDVVTRDLTKLPRPDARRLQRLPPGIRVFSAAEPEPWVSRAEQFALRATHGIRSQRAATGAATSATNGAVASTRRAERSRPSVGRRMLRAYSAWAWVSKENAWAAEAASIGIRLAQEQPFDAVISSGPPHMAHEGARRVAKAVDAPLIIDLRDPWNTTDMVPEDRSSAAWFALARHYERKAVEQARLVVVNTDLSRDDMRRRYPEAGPIITVRNGSDDESLPEVSRPSHFSIRFAGSIYFDRDPRLLFRAAARVVERNKLTPRDLLMEFIGNVDEVGGKSIREMAQEEGFSDFVRISGPVPRDEALKFLAGATVLLSLPQGADMCIPAKIFEYVRFNAWLLALASAGTATAALLRDSDADVVDPADVDGMASAIERRYKSFVLGQRPTAVGEDGRFDRRRQAELLLDQLDAITTR